MSWCCAPPIHSSWTVLDHFAQEIAHRELQEEIAERRRIEDRGIEKGREAPPCLALYLLAGAIVGQGRHVTHARSALVLAGALVSLVLAS
jgi:hypothetical protein